MRRIAVCPGSFDPVTLGHLDIITRASTLFDKVIVLISTNASKNAASFTATERMMMIADATAHLDNVVIDILDGLLVNYVRRVQAVAIVKGLRAVSDFDYEFQILFRRGHQSLCTSLYPGYHPGSIDKGGT